MKNEFTQGQFAVIDSFAIEARNEFYLIGELIGGTAEPGWFVNIALNATLGLTVRIKAIEEVKFTHERDRYKLIIIDSDEESTALLLGLNIGSEQVMITVDGKD
jgi:hypothetical protein